MPYDVGDDALGQPRADRIVIVVSVGWVTNFAAQSGTIRIPKNREGNPHERLGIRGHRREHFITLRAYFPER
jgi:hypothetical protein